MTSVIELDDFSIKLDDFSINLGNFPTDLDGETPGRVAPMPSPVA